MASAKNFALLLIVLVIQLNMSVTIDIPALVQEMVRAKIDHTHRVLDEIIRTGPPVVSSHRSTYRLSDPEEDKETKRVRAQWKHLADCKNSMRPQRECDVYYEQTFLGKEDLITRLKYYHKLDNEIVYSNIDLTTASKEDIFEWKDKMERVRNMKPDLYPWLEIHEKCTKTNLSKDACYELVKNLQSSPTKDSQPRYLIMAAEVYICIMSGKTEEDCKLEALERKQRDEL